MASNINVFWSSQQGIQARGPSCSDSIVDRERRQEKRIEQQWQYVVEEPRRAGRAREEKHAEQMEIHWQAILENLRKVDKEEGSGRKRQAVRSFSEDAAAQPSFSFAGDQTLPAAPETESPFWFEESCSNPACSEDSPSSLPETNIIESGQEQSLSFKMASISAPILETEKQATMSLCQNNVKNLFWRFSNSLQDLSPHFRLAIQKDPILSHAEPIYQVQSTRENINLESSDAVQMESRWQFAPEELMRTEDLNKWKTRQRWPVREKSEAELLENHQRRLKRRRERYHERQLAKKRERDLDADKPEAQEQGDPQVAKRRRIDPPAVLLDLSGKGSSESVAVQSSCSFASGQTLSAAPEMESNFLNDPTSWLSPLFDF